MQRTNAIYAPASLPQSSAVTFVVQWSMSFHVCKETDCVWYSPLRQILVQTPFRNWIKTYSAKIDKNVASKRDRMICQEWRIVISGRKKQLGKDRSMIVRQVRATIPRLLPGFSSASPWFPSSRGHTTSLPSDESSTSHKTE